MDCKKLDIKNLASIELYCVIAKKKTIWKMFESLDYRLWILIKICLLSGTSSMEPDYIYGHRIVAFLLSTPYSGLFG